MAELVCSAIIKEGKGIRQDRRSLSVCCQLSIRKQEAIAEPAKSAHPMLGLQFGPRNIRQRNGLLLAPSWFSEKHRRVRSFKFRHYEVRAVISSALNETLPLLVSQDCPRKIARVMGRACAVNQVVKACLPALFEWIIFPFLHFVSSDWIELLFSLYHKSKKMEVLSYRLLTSAVC